jgi:thiol-disulfide isomerase/thioredoxin
MTMNSARPIRITHTRSETVIAEGPPGFLGITSFEGNLYISRKCLKTRLLRPNWIPGVCVYKFLYVWLDLTWCAACRTELPILDRLFGQKRRSGLEIVAVSTDRGDRETVARFVRASRIASLPIYRDPNAYVAFSDRDNAKKAPFALFGMPITYLITASGRVVGYMPGAADWMSEEASEVIDYLRRS